jgi:hypothetical protein
MYKSAIPIYSIDISEDEKSQAANTREEFQVLLEVMDEVVDYLNILNNALEGIQDTSELGQFNKLFLRYKRKARRLFNVFIKQLEKALKNVNKTITDTELDRIRDTIVAEVREIRDGAIELFDLLENPEEKTFVQEFRSTVERLIIRSDALKQVITDQLFSHIDHDILGQIRLGFLLKPVIKRSTSWDLSNVPLRR